LTPIRSVPNFKNGPESVDFRLLIFVSLTFY